MSVLFVLNENKEGLVEHFGIGSNTAELTEELLNENPEFKKQMQVFCDELCRQHGLDAVRVHGIDFSTVRYGR